MPDASTPTDWSKRLAQATQVHQRGDLDQAKTLYYSLLTEQPDHADALHMLGVIAFQQQRMQDAIDLIGRAMALDPLRSDFASNRGLAWQALQQPAQAMLDFERAVALDAASASAHYNLGTARQQLRQHTLALQSYDQTLALAPRFADAWVNSGVALQELGKWHQAIGRYQQALRLDPANANAHSNQGVALQAQGRQREALAHCEQAIALQPQGAQHHYNRANVLRELGQFDAAVAAYDQAIALQAHYVQAHSNRGVALQKLGNTAAAIASYDSAIALDANAAHPHYNRGNALHELQLLDAAVASYDQALHAQADYPEAHWNKSLTLLLAGDFAQGLPLYEWRWHPHNQNLNQAQPPIPQAPWLGQTPLAGKTLLLHAEQGLGDSLQFCRYVPQLAAMGATVMLEVQAPLQRLLRGLSGMGQLLIQGEARPAFDLHCPLMSLPLALLTHHAATGVSEAWLGATTQTRTPAYLHADTLLQQGWEARLASAERQDLPIRLPRVGLVWRGSVTHANDQQRSMALSTLLAYLPAAYQYVSLQKEVGAQDAAALRDQTQILHFGELLADFADTAALVACLDRVVCVDTAVAHLAASMGKETCLLLPFVPDWRWQLERRDSPWYPSMRLYRQTTRGNWATPLEELHRDLTSALADKPA